MRKLHRVLRLSPQDSIHLLFLLFTTFNLLAAIRLGLFLLPFRILLRLLGKMSKPLELPSAKGIGTVRKIVWAVEVSSRWMPGGVKCLARALTTKVLLNWYGCAPDLKIGVAKSNGGHLEAHAWIEYQDRVVIGNLHDLARYIPLPSIEGFKQ